MSLLERLRERIVTAGPMPFETFMEACLYDPDAGFFATGPLRSVKAGDFLTSPEVSPWFGRTLGRFAAAEMARIGEPGGGPFVVADIGAGSGSLLETLSEGMGHGAQIWAADASPAARRALAAHDGWNVVHDLIGVPAPANGVIFANELLDNIPVALVVREGDGWQERCVGLGDDGLSLVRAKARSEVVDWADRFAGVVPQGGLVEVQLGAGEWLTAALARLGSGAVVVIDYGGTAEELEPRRTQGTLRTYRAHHLGPDPLLAPGSTDVTVDVNFTALVAVAEGAGASVEVHRQDDFLASWGLRDEIGRMRREELELARGTDTMARLRIRSERTGAETLVHPRGLGDFRVLVARPG
jgi:SAM-dependent MidA family methyltransferase